MQPTPIQMSSPSDTHNVTRRQLVEFVQIAYDWGYDDAEREVVNVRNPQSASSETHLFAYSEGSR